MYTFAIPDHWSWYAIHRAPVPLKLNVARAPLSTAMTALPPLWNEPVFGCHVPTYVIAELLCSARVHVVEPDVAELDVSVTPVEPAVVVPLVPVVAAALVTAEE